MLAVGVLVPERVLALEIPLYYNYNFHFIAFTSIITETVAFSEVFSVPFSLHMFNQFKSYFLEPFTLMKIYEMVYRLFKKKHPKFNDWMRL